MKITILGASSGFGREFTKLLISTDNEITAISNDEKGLEALREYDPGITLVCRDLTNPADLDYVCERHTDCDFLINSAGGGMLGDITSSSIEEDQYYMRLNVWALHKITKTALLGMIERRQGKLLNICSMASFFPFPNFSLYASTKAFSGSYTLALAKEVEKYGIHVMALFPGPTRTNFLPQEAFDNIQKKYHDLSIYMKPDVIAKMALKNFDKGKIAYIPGASNKILKWAGRFASIKLLNNIIFKMHDGLL